VRGVNAQPNEDENEPHKGLLYEIKVNE
jgi:hypothetical protein